MALTCVYIYAVTNMANVQTERENILNLTYMKWRNGLNMCVYIYAVTNMANVQTERENILNLTIWTEEMWRSEFTFALHTA